MKHMQMRANERRLHASHVRSGSLSQTARALTAFALAQRGKTERPKKASALFMLFNYQRFIRAPRSFDTTSLLRDVFV